MNKPEDLVTLTDLDGQKCAIFTLALSGIVISFLIYSFQVLLPSINMFVLTWGLPIILLNPSIPSAHIQPFPVRLGTAIWSTLYFSYKNKWTSQWIMFFGCLFLIGEPAIRHAATLMLVHPSVITQEIIQLEAHSTSTHNQPDLIAVSPKKGNVLYKTNTKSFFKFHKQIWCSEWR